MLNIQSPATDPDLDGEVRFMTSGHTALPIAWFRTHDQLDREVRMVLGTEYRKPECIISFAPSHHLYGHIFSKHLPRTHSIPVVEAWRDMLSVPELPPEKHVLIVATPGCWRIVREMSRHTDPAHWKLLHSGGFLPMEARSVVESITRKGAEVLEILGSTETGGVATRKACTDSENPWHLLGDVDLIGAEPGGHTLLSVTSPRLGRREDMKTAPVCWTLPDLIDVLSDGRHFHYIGRESRFVKVDGRRCSLDAIESRIRSLPSIQDAVCIARFSKVRGEHYDVFFVARDAGTMKEDLNAIIINACKGLPLPRVTKRVETIPHNSLGKVLFSEMAERDV